MNQSWEFVISAAILIVLARNYKVSIYYLKFIYYYSATISIITLLIPYFLLKPKNVHNLLVYSSASRHISRIIGIKWHLRGVEHLEKDRTCVFIANHQSSLDVQGMMNIWHVTRKMTAVAKRELIYLSGTFGVASWLAGLYFIDRKSGGRAGHALNDAIKEFKKKNIKLWVFPEGTRRNTGEIHDFKKGAFHAAIQAQVPIVPVVFSSYKHFLDTKQKIFNEGEVIITALPEISTVGMTAEDVDRLLQITRNAMVEVFEKTSKETEETLKLKEDLLKTD